MIKTEKHKIFLIVLLLVGGFLMRRLLCPVVNRYSPDWVYHDLYGVLLLYFSAGLSEYGYYQLSKLLSDHGHRVWATLIKVVFFLTLVVGVVLLAVYIVSPSSVRFLA